MGYPLPSKVKHVKLLHRSARNNKNVIKEEIIKNKNVIKEAGPSGSGQNSRKHEIWKAGFYCIRSNRSGLDYNQWSEFNLYVIKSERFSYTGAYCAPDTQGSSKNPLVAAKGGGSFIKILQVVIGGT